MVKRLSVIIFFISVFLSFSSPNNALAACTCNAVNNVNILVNNNCSSSKIPVMYIDIGASSGCRCACEDPTAPPTRLESSLCADKVSVNTAFGCVPVQMDKFISWLLPYIFGIGGSIAFILMIVGFVQMTTSNGDPKAVQGAKETISSAIIGLLICLFAIFLLRLIAVDILQIPGIS